MRKFYYLMAFLVIGGLAGCSDDEDGTSYSFKDQNLLGEITGTSWNFGDGYVEVSGDSDEYLSFDLYSDEETEDPCNIYLSDYKEAFFTVPNEEGVYKLNFDLEDWSNSTTVTLYDPDGSQNMIASDGAVEITSITSTTISGRIDAKVDGDNYINGNFSVDFCKD